MTQVFISYSRKDLAFVQRLAKDLKAAGLDTWYDLSNLEVGTRWGMELQKAILQSQYFLIVLSPNSIASEWVEKEFLFANRHLLKIIPVMQSECSLPLWFINLQYIDLQTSNYEIHINDLLESLGSSKCKKAEKSILTTTQDIESRISELTHKKPKHNLPIQLTSFIGREKEITEVKRMLNERRLVTLTGPGGTGKTQLAIRTATDLVDSFQNGVWLVELAPLTDPLLVLSTIAYALNLREQQNRPIKDTLIDYLREKTLLIILDNCEHLVEACASLADSLLQSCPGLRILASSREPLGVAGETTFRLPPLTTPDPQQLPLTSTLLQYEAVQLFIDRAITALPTFALTDDNAPVLARICQRLDGIPLAIELAAARMEMLSLEQIADRLDDVFRLLTGGSRTALPRLQTLRATIDWSYNLLTIHERRLLYRFSVFPGNWNLEAAETICNDEEVDPDFIDLLTQLIKKSMVIAEREKGKEARYHLLDTVRQYAREKLVEAGESNRVHSKHLEHFLKFAEESEPHLLRSEQMEWLGGLEKEHDNLRAALEWSIEEGSVGPQKEYDLAFRLANSLDYLWYRMGYWQEGREAVRRIMTSFDMSILSRPRAMLLLNAGILEDNVEQGIRLIDQSITACRKLGDKSVLARALRAKAINLISLTDYSTAKTLLDESLLLFRELEDQWGIAQVMIHYGQVEWESNHDGIAARRYVEEGLRLHRKTGNWVGMQFALMILGYISLAQGDFSDAFIFTKECLKIARELGNRISISQGLNNMGWLTLGQGDYTKAIKILEEALEISQDVGDTWTTIKILDSMGCALRFQGDYRKAKKIASRTLSLARQNGDNTSIALALFRLGETARLEGKYPSSRSYYQKALAIGKTLNDIWLIVNVIEGVAALCFEQKAIKTSAILYGAANNIRSTSHEAPQPVETLKINQNIDLIKAHLDNSAFDSAWDEGHKMSIKQAIASLQEHLKALADLGFPARKN